MADTQIASLAGILFRSQGEEGFAIIYIQDLHGIESRDRALIELKQRGYSDSICEKFSLRHKGLDPLLKEAKARLMSMPFWLLFIPMNPSS